MLAGQLEIDLVAGIAQFSKDMAQMKRDVTGHMKDVSDAVNLTKKGLEALGLTLSVGFAVEFVKSSIEATARMKDLASQAGTTAEAISRFELPARAAGSSLDSVSLAMARMSKAIVEAQDPTNKSSKALEAIGLSAKQLLQLKPDEAFELIARKLATFGDGMQKNAVEMQIFSRSGAEMNKVVHEIAETGQLQATVTNEQAERAQALSRAMIELKMSSEAAWRSMIDQGVPALTQIIQKFTEGKEKGGLFQGIIDGLATAFEKINGDSLQDQLKRVNDQISVESANVEQMTNGWRSLVVTEKERAAATEHLNQLLVQRQNVERAIFGQELDAQNRRAIAGQTKKPTPNFDPNGNAASGEAAFTAEMARLDQEIARLNNVGELEAYITKLGTDRFKLLTQPEKDELVQKEKLLLDLKNEIEARKLIYASAVALIEAMQKMRDAEQQARDAARDQVEQGQFDLSLLGKSSQEQEKLNALRAIDLELRKQIQQVDVEDGDFQSAAQIAEAQRLQDIAEKRKASIGAILDQKKAISDQLAVWNQVGDVAGQFFSDLVLHGKSAFDNLRQYVKQLLGDLISLFAKRFILQLAANATGSSSVGNAAASAGANSLTGSIVSAAGSYLGGVTGASAFYAGAASAASEAAIGASFVGPSATLASGAVGAGAEAYSAISGVLGSIPVYGWIALAVIAIAAYFGGKGGGPKTGGSSFGSYDTTGAFTGTTSVPGSDNGRFYTPNNLDPQMQQYSDAVAKSYVAAVTRYGGTALGLDIGAGTDSDPQGSAQSRISGLVVNHATGQVLYQNQDLSMDDKAVPQALGLQAQQMVIAALQHSDLPQYLANVFKGVDAVTLTQDQVNNLFAMADALKGIMDVVTRDPLADAAQAFADSLDPFNAAIRNNGAAMRAVMDAYDGTTASAQGLQQATVAYYNAQVQLLNQITQAKQAIDGLFGDTFRGFKLAGLNDQEKYNFYQQEAKDLTAQALASTDPAEIQRLVGLITQDEQAAFALLSPDQQAGADGRNFITLGTAAQTAIDQHLDSIKDAVADATRDTLSEIKDLIAGPNNSMNSAANTMNNAANTIDGAASKPLHVVVDNFNSAEVTG